MTANKRYDNIDKCVFGAEDIKVLGCFVTSAGVRADLEKVKDIAAWPTPGTQKDLRKWLGLATYLHKYNAGVIKTPVGPSQEGHGLTLGTPTPRGF
ncbi:unnamed protein product [Phytophthora fragariaefolia]|uniref:Unnamed protein product n=1 Tax=Phytophthora fragariaefolia TaxID=1490495 RepID=A0A9W6XN37_9STRA|nr:unnamed protein product [Phytophthora fragariaefolia]